ncbi:HAD hydrolase-like protein [Nocardia sp. N13]|uniref:HAD hydrolase-like protein n=1 Tax=Nocardioides sp. N13(2025) TaxID=3453405 RepID=UPI003F75F8EB
MRSDEEQEGMPDAGFPAAVLWDMDGTLVDTEPYWIATEFAMAEKYGGTWSQEHALNLVGKALLDSGEYIRVHMGIDRTPQEIVDEPARRRGGAGGGARALAPRRARACSPTSRSTASPVGS